MKELGERIKDVRKDVGLTQDEFAQMLGTTRGALAQIETGRSRPKEVMLKSILKTYPDLSENWLRYGSGDMHDRARVSQQELADLLKLVSDLPDDSPKRRMIISLANLIGEMSTRQVEMITDFITSLAEKMK